MKIHAFIRRMGPFKAYLNAAAFWALGMAIVLAVHNHGLPIGTLAHGSPPTDWVDAIMWMLGGASLALGLAVLQWHRLEKRLSQPVPVTGITNGLSQMDRQMAEQLQRVVDLSEASSLAMIDRVTGLRGLSARLMDYLRLANRQSSEMQAEIEQNGRIIRELASFVEQLPVQISEERRQMDLVVAEVKRLSGITETIRGMARQTEILSINAAVAAAHAGEAGKGFAVLAGEVRRLAMQSNDAAHEIEQHIENLVTTVITQGGQESKQRLAHNEQEAIRLVKLTDKLDEGYLDIRQFYAMLLTAITEHNAGLDTGITELLSVGQHQDVYKQIIDRLQLAFNARHEVVVRLCEQLAAPGANLQELESQVQLLQDSYLNAEAMHRDPDAGKHEQPGDPGLRIELF